MGTYVVSKVDEDKIRVNGKLVYRDMEGNWSSRVELTTKEQEALSEYLQD